MIFWREFVGLLVLVLALFAVWHLFRREEVDGDVYG